MLRRVLRPVVEVRDTEAVTLLLMFAYSFLAMTGYNILKPITRSKFITSLGADNLPYVLLAAGFLIGVLMTGYTWLIARLPRRWGLPITQTGLVALLVVFWFLFQTGQAWVSVLFYLFGLILGVLLISQFWTLANVVYDPRQAKRMFGFIGGGAPLGGIVGSVILTTYTATIGTTNLLLVSAVLLTICVVVTVSVIRREQPEDLGSVAAGAEEKGVGAFEAFRLLRESRHLQIIAVVISFAAIGASLIEQQLNMAVEAQVQAAGSEAAADAITQRLGTVQFWTSTIGFVIQVWLVSRIQRFLGVGFALMLLPIGLGVTASLMLVTGAFWGASVARVFDQSVRYTVDKTTREILFLPLPTELKYKAKPFVDVTMDRFAKAMGALLLLVLIKPWGLNLSWPQISWASLSIMTVWIVMALRAKRGYLAGFRRSIERREVAADQVRLNVADLSTVETLIEELANPEERRVLYAIEILESLDKRNLITPLLLYHESPRVRARALDALGSARSELAERWLPAVQRMIGDQSSDVRAAAFRALVHIRQGQAPDLIRPYLNDSDTRVATTAAAVLAQSQNEVDIAAAEAALARVVADTRDGAVSSRRDAAIALGEISDPRFHHLVVPLLYDSHLEVAEEALRTVQRLGTSDFLFVPTLVALLRNRKLKSGAREVLVGYGEGVLDVLAHFLKSPDEDIWVRRHLPATIAAIPCQKAMDVLVGTLDDPDGFLRYKALSAVGRLHLERPDLTLDSEITEKLVVRESLRHFEFLSLYYNLFDKGGLSKDTLLARALREKSERAIARIYALLALLYPGKDVAAVQWAIENGSNRQRASASEYLDNILTAPLRKALMPIFEDMPPEERVRRANVVLRTRPRDVDETLLHLINNEDQIISASAIHFVQQLKVRNLVDDIEYVLAHRDAKDWYVFEGASWAVASFRMPEERKRALWLEPLPAVELADRLRAVPLFAFVSVDELFRMAGAGKQIRHVTGQVLYQEGAPVESLLFLLDGKLDLHARAGPVRRIEPPAPLGLEEVLEGSPAHETARTAETSVVLTLSSEQCLQLLVDNTDLVQGLFRTVLDSPQFSAGRLVLEGTGSDELAKLAAGGLLPIERVLVLRLIPVFARAASDDLLKLAAITHEVKLTANTTLFKEEDPAALYALVAGRVSLEADEAAAVPAQAGDAVGVYETLAGVPMGRRARVIEDGIALRIDREALFDLLAHRPTLIQELFSALFRTRSSAPVGVRK
jgi:AAA family ATP:ADP antiporter